jgi:hypothetical protein
MKPKTDAIMTTCRCGFEIVAVLPCHSPSARPKPAMVAWSHEGGPVILCPQCRRLLPHISVDQFKQQIAGEGLVL